MQNTEIKKENKYTHVGAGFTPIQTRELDCCIHCLFNKVESVNCLSCKTQHQNYTCQAYNKQVTWEEYMQHKPEWCKIKYLQITAVPEDDSKVQPNSVGDKIEIPAGEYNEVEDDGKGKLCGLDDICVLESKTIGEIVQVDIYNAKAWIVKISEGRLVEVWDSDIKGKYL